MSDLLRAKLNDHIVIFDGAMGTELYNRNFFLNSCYENLNLTNPDAVLGIHVAYFDSGAEVLTTNTYGANRLKLSRHGLAEQIGEINRAGVHLARRAGDETTLVAGSVGPLGREQMSGHSQEELIEVFGEQIGYLQSAGADFILGESMPSLSDARLFLKAVEKYSDIPYMISFATDRDLTLAFGEDLAPFMNEIKALSKAPTAIGLNCGIGPEPMLAALEKLDEKAKSLSGMGEMLGGGMSAMDYGLSQFASFSPEHIGHTPIGFSCPCSKEHFESYLKTLPQSEKEAILKGTFPLTIECFNCGTQYSFTKEETSELFREDL